MQNINIAYALQPLIVTIATFLFLAYFVRKKRFTKYVFIYTLLAYGIAIGAKAIFQTFTIGYVESYGNPYLLGIYYGLQTAIFEVGIAYLFARYAASKKQIKIEEARAYGAGLAFWENGILLGLFSLINLFSVYAVLGSTSPEAQVVYNTLMKSSPVLFSTSSSVLFTVFLGIVERTSSIIIHYAWGILVVFAAVTRKKKYLLYALPMGLIDALVPFAKDIPLYYFEGLLFAIAVLALIFTLRITKKE